MGMGPETIFEDENGNVLHETKDGIDATVVVSNENVSGFMLAVDNLEDPGVLNVQTTEERNTII